MEIEFRTARAADFDRAADLVCQVHALHVAGRPDIYRDAPALTNAQFRQMLDHPQALVETAWRGDALVGLAMASLRGPSDNPTLCPRRVAMLEVFVVDAAVRASGVGTRMMARVERWAQRHGAQSLELMVWAFNTQAMDFYKNRGMTVRSLILEKSIAARADAPWQGE